MSSTEVLLRVARQCVERKSATEHALK